MNSAVTLEQLRGLMQNSDASRLTDADCALDEAAQFLGACERYVRQLLTTPPASGEVVGVARNDHDRKRVIAALQSTNDRLAAILIPKYGDQLDGFFDAMRDAINWMKRAKPRAAAPKQATDGGL